MKVRLTLSDDVECSLEYSARESFQIQYAIGEVIAEMREKGPHIHYALALPLRVTEKLWGIRLRRLEGFTTSPLHSRVCVHIVARAYGILLANSFNSYIANLSITDSGVLDFYISAPSYRDINIYNNVVVNVNGTENKPIFYSNKPVHIQNWYNNISEIVLCNADNSVVEGVVMAKNGTKNNGILLIETDCVKVSNVSVIGFKYGLLLESSSNNTISENNITNNEFSINLFCSNDNIIRENFIAKGCYGINVLGSSFNTISNNTITQITYPGDIDACIRFDDSNNNNVTYNIACLSDFGIKLEFSNNNKITGNRVLCNQVGIELDNACENEIYFNDFRDNSNQIYDVYWQYGCTSSINSWHIGYPMGGNHWSDYPYTDFYSGPYQNETGSDGIGDTPYVINQDTPYVINQDNYPLMGASRFFIQIYPFEGEIISCNTSIRFDIHSTFLTNISTIEIYIDDVLAYTGLYPYNEFSWNTTKYFDGLHKVSVIVYDDLNAKSFNQSVMVTVDNTTPITWIDSPTRGSVLSGTAVINFTASDNHLKLVQLVLDENIHNVTDVRSFVWDTSTMEDGNHTIAMKVTDKAGNYVTKSITVLIDNTLPTILIRGPYFGATVGSTIPVKVDASDNFGISMIEFYINNALFHTCYEAPWLYDWETTMCPNGEYSVVAIAYDKAGLSISDEVRVVVKNPSTTWYVEYRDTIVALCALLVSVFSLLVSIRRPSERVQQLADKREKDDMEKTPPPKKKVYANR